MIVKSVAGRMNSMPLCERTSERTNERMSERAQTKHTPGFLCLTFFALLYYLCVLRFVQCAVYASVSLYDLYPCGSLFGTGAKQSMKQSKAQHSFATHFSAFGINIHLLI